MDLDPMALGEGIVLRHLPRRRARRSRLASRLRGAGPRPRSGSTTARREVDGPVVWQKAVIAVLERIGAVDMRVRRDRAAVVLARNEEISATIETERARREAAA